MEKIEDLKQLANGLCTSAKLFATLHGSSATPTPNRNSPKVQNVLDDFFKN